MRRTWRTRVLMGFGLLTGSVVVTVVAAVAYLTLFDLGRHRSQIENRLSNVLGLEVRATELHVNLDSGGRIRIEAQGITASNPGSQDSPELMEVARLAAEIELWPLFKHTVHVVDLALVGGRIAVAVDDSGRANWTSAEADIDGPPGDAGGEAWNPEIVIDRARCESVAVSVAAPTFTHLRELMIHQLAVSTDASNALLMQLDGESAGHTLRLDSRVHDLDQLLRGSRLGGELGLSIDGDTHLSLRGHVAELVTMTEPEIEISAHGPRADGLGWLLGETTLPAEAFRVAARLTPGDGRIDVNVDATLGELEVEADGAVDSLVRPADLDLTVAASGPNLAEAAAVFGAAGTLPADSFTISGRVAWNGFPLTLYEVEVEVGGNHFEADGVIGQPPGLAGSDLRFAGFGPDLSAVTSVAGLELPPMPYRCSGRLERAGPGATSIGLQASYGANRIELSGTVSDNPGTGGDDLAIHLSGPSLAPFSRLAGLKLPHERFEIEGRVLPVAGAIDVPRATARLGSTSIRLSGRISVAEDLHGSSVKLVVEGESLANLRWAPGLELMPAVPFSADGVIAIDRRRVWLRPLEASIGTVEVRVEGNVDLAPRARGSDLEFVLSGSDASRVLSLVDLEGGIGMPFDVAGRLQLWAEQLELSEVAAHLGDSTLRVTGAVPLEGGLDGLELHVEGDGPRLRELADFGAPAWLPDVPFTVAGGLRGEGRFLRLVRATAVLGGEHRVVVDGPFAVANGLVGTAATIELSGPSFGEVGEMLADDPQLPPLPSQPYSLTVGLQITADNLEIRSLHAELGSATADLSGRVGRPPDFVGTELDIDINGPDASLLTALSGVIVPVAPFEVRGRTVRDLRGFAFHGLSVQLGQHRAQIEGRLGNLPTLEGSDLLVEAEGPSLELIAELTGAPSFPELPFRVSGHARGSPQLFTVDELALRYGDSDIGGRVQIEIADRPRIEVRLQSEVLDLEPLMLQRAAGDPADLKDTPPTPVRTRILADDPLALDWLDRFDAEVKWSIERLRLTTGTITGIELPARLERGHVDLGPFAGIGDRGGYFSGKIDASPGDGGYELYAWMGLDNGQAKLAPGESSDETPRTNVDAVLELHSRGGTPHELASAAVGVVVLSLAGGEVDGSILDLIGAPLILTMVQALNPFHGRSAGKVGVDCGVLKATVANGVVVLDPVALKTARLSVIGHGAVDLESETLDFEWVTKPRKGIGLSASAVTNAYVKVGGTLAAPTISIKSIEAVAATGAAVATGGLSLLGRALWDRVTAERKFCDGIQQETEALLAGAALRGRSVPRP